MKITIEFDKDEYELLSDMAETMETTPCKVIERLVREAMRLFLSGQKSGLNKLGS